MGTSTWVIATSTTHLAAAVCAAQALEGKVTVVAVGPRELADAASALGPDDVAWVETGELLAEALAARVAAAAAAEGPHVLVATGEPAARVLLGACAARAGAAVVPGVRGLGHQDGAVVVERTAVGGAVIQTLATTGPVAVVLDADDDAVPAVGATAQVRSLPVDVPAADVRVVQRRAVSVASGVRDAARVVSVGRGVKAKADIALVESLAAALGGEVACSMPVAEDLGWVAKERYVGRSGQHISPRLYLALGISGTPQHMEGVREAKVVAAVNNDPSAPIFATADYGIVGDLYEVVPALMAALTS